MTVPREDRAPESVKQISRRYLNDCHVGEQKRIVVIMLIIQLGSLLVAALYGR